MPEIAPYGLPLRSQHDAPPVCLLPGLTSSCIEDGQVSYQMSMESCLPRVMCFRLTA
jgi:hypothetical protein